MRWLLTTVCLLASLTPVLAEDRLPARSIEVPLAVVPDHGPWSFDLIDFREEERLARANLLPRADVDPHSFFIVKHHLGVAGGYDNGIAHGSVGYYLTVAEWGRWNFGVPSIEIGIGRYPMIDRDSEAIDHEGPDDVHGQHHLGALPRRLHSRVGRELLPESGAGVRPAREPHRRRNSACRSATNNDCGPDQAGACRVPVARTWGALQRPDAARPRSTALNPASPQFITNTLKPCFMRISMSAGVAGNPHGTWNSLQADSTVWMAFSHAGLIEHAFAGGVGGREDSAQRAGARPQHADSLHLRDLTHVREPFLALDDGPVDELAVGIERPQIGLLLVFLLGHAPDRGAMPTSSGRVPPCDLKRIAAMPARTSSALSVSTNMMPLTPRFSSRLMSAAPRGRSGAIFGALTISGCAKRGNGDFVSRPASAVALMKSVNAADGAIDAALHAAVEQEVGVAVRQRVLRPVRRRAHDGVSRRRSTPASLRIARPVDAEQRFVLLEQIDHRVQPLARLRLATMQKIDTMKITGVKKLRRISPPSTPTFDSDLRVRP